jgi:hypothetical protein
MILTLALTIGTGIAVGGKGLGPPARDAFWIDDMPYRTILTPTDLPDHGPTDGLYVIEGLGGQLPVGEAKPGDKDYNGGRWEVTVLEFTPEGLLVHDPDGDGVNNIPLTNWEMVEHHIGLGHVAVVGPGPSFVCPVIKQK